MTHHNEVEGFRINWKAIASKRLLDAGVPPKTTAELIIILDGLLSHVITTHSAKVREEERENVKHEVIKLLAGNNPIYDKRKASGYNEGITSGWYAAREFIRLELTPQTDVTKN